MFKAVFGFKSVAGKDELSSVLKANNISLSSERIELETSSRPIFSTEDKSSKTNESVSNISGSKGNNFALSLNPVPTDKLAKFSFPEDISSIKCRDRVSAH